MKWYIEFLIVYAVVFLVLFIGNAWDEATWFVAMIGGLFISVAFYSGYDEYRKNSENKVLGKIDNWDDWKKIDELPTWVVKAKKKSNHTYFKGSNFIYKIENGIYYMRKK